jgi:nitrate reductase cytochrome c-type subunit
MEAENFLLPGHKRKEGRHSVPSTIVIGHYGRPDRQLQFNANSKSKRYFCLRRCRLPQRICDTPRRLNIIFALEMVYGSF